MFRDLYKKANDEIKGDRAILDKAFLKAAQPEKKKSPVFKYSFVGTVVAAVMVLGAVFANPSVFTNRSDDIGTLENPTEATATAAENKEIAIVSEMNADETAEAEVSVEETVTNKPAVQEKVSTAQPKTTETVQQQGGGGGSEDSVAAEAEEPDGETDYSAMVMSLEGEEDAVYENATEEAMIGFTLRDTQIVEEATEDVTENEIPAFSYMYDLSCGYSAMTEGFVNTSVSPVTTIAEAIARAENEYSGEYDSVYVYYDSIEGIWKVVFACDDLAASETIVYMSSDGITLMLVNLA